MSQGTLEDSFFDFDRMHGTVSEDDLMSFHSSVAPQSQTIFDARPSPELLDKYTDDDFDTILSKYQLES